QLVHSIQHQHPAIGIQHPATMPAPRPRKRFGQHFLSDPRLLDRIADALGPTREDAVVEIGPGRGALTDRLADRAGRVVAIEIDRDLAALLQTRYRDRPHVEIVTGDALEEDWGALAGGPYLLAGNLPYYITTPLLFRALERPRPVRAVLLVQREVAERIVAPPGSREYGALSVNVQLFAQAEVVGRVPAGAFRPVPEVDSAIVRMIPYATGPVPEADEPALRRFVQGIFAYRRKQITRAVRELAGLDAPAAAAVVREAGIERAARPETLSPDEFVRLFRACAPYRDRFESA
ncbi:MAG TPA: 16S rRNA (adenine(1518)-N(6)/adenine(1519)-N(6))-dimethyltransferase RsmA, partial [Gemmatimonadaceae bacterium]